MSLDFDLKLPLRDFDLELEGSFDKGITGILGPSGAGKTSFFNLLSGLVRPEKGYIKLNEKTFVNTEQAIDVPVHKRKVGFVFQDSLLFPHMTVKENLCFALPYAELSKLELEEVVEMLKLGDLLNSKPGNISGGEQQRAAIGRALLMSPQLLLMDEPFNAIDYKLRSSVLQWLKTLEERLAIPILIISHDREDMKKLTERICLFSRGRMKGPGKLLEAAV